jgi:hypothetical protein
VTRSGDSRHNRTHALPSLVHTGIIAASVFVRHHDLPDSVVHQRDSITEPTYFVSCRDRVRALVRNRDSHGDAVNARKLRCIETVAESYRNSKIGGLRRVPC